MPSIQQIYSSAFETGLLRMRHRHIDVNGHRTFYREDGPADAPVVLLPHGYPCSSYQFRRLMPALADRWRTLAPDFPGFGYTSTPDPTAFSYDFDSYARFLEGFANALGLSRYVVWLHDYGSQIGLRHAIAHPERIRALIIQNGDIYQDALGPKYATIQAYWNDKTPQNHRPLEEAVNEEGFRHEFIGEVAPDVAERISPDLWTLHWRLMDTPVRRALSVGLMEKLEENLSWFPRYQAYLRERQPQALIVWGPEDGYMPRNAAVAYLRDLPNAELHLLDGAGHWLLETHFDHAVALVRDFLARIHD
jgi:pimeloyl-ACP methyl ester carboxylesterase